MDEHCKIQWILYAKFLFLIFQEIQYFLCSNDNVPERIKTSLKLDTSLAKKIQPKQGLLDEFIKSICECFIWKFWDPSYWRQRSSLQRERATSQHETLTYLHFPCCYLSDILPYLKKFDSIFCRTVRLSYWGFRRWNAASCGLLASSHCPWPCGPARLCTCPPCTSDSFRMRTPAKKACF